jgi:hypothetical protein
MRVLILSLLLFLGFNTSSQAQRGKWVKVEKSSNLTEDVTIRALKQELLAQARREAVVEVTGQQITATQQLTTSETQLEGEFKTFENFVEMMTTEVSGKIVDEKEPSFNLELRGQTIYLSLAYEGKVAKESVEPDPSFFLEFTTSRSSYELGEPVEMMVKPSKESYITIFSILPDNSVAVIFPNAYMSDNKVGKFEERRIPNESEKKILEFTTAETDELKAPYAEMLLCVATKKPFEFDAPQEGTDYNTAFTKINKLLMSIPRDERVQAFAQYSVVK